MAKLNPNSELVAVNYIRAMNLGPSASFGVGGTLPEDKLTWKDGFVQISVVGGAPSIDLPVSSPLIQVDCWVPSINSAKPQWGRANTIAEDVKANLYTLANTGVKLSLGTFKDATIQSAYAVSEPRKITNDPAGHARYTMDIVLNWVISESAPV